MLNNQQIEQRKPVWEALSNLWLDTELDEADLEFIASVLDQSHLSVPELHWIYLYEVAPVVYINLWSVAGEWAGFNQEWLVEQILNKIKNTNRIKRTCYLFFRPILTFGTSRQWQAILKKIKEKRQPS